MLKLLSVVALFTAAPDSVPYNGRAGQLDVSPPKLANPTIAIDGNLDEAAWVEAAPMDGFTQNEPIERLEASGKPEGDRTYQLSRLNPVEEGFFVKLSYLFRM
jgi:hypothetical protein